MAINLDIAPDGMDAFIKGFGLTDNLMKQLLERRRLKQSEEQFKEELALKKQAAARAGANADIQRKILEQQLLGLTHKNDPMYEINQFAALQNMLTGGGGGRGPINLEALRQNPILRGFFKYKFGIDPLAPLPENPEQKSARHIRESEEIAKNKANLKIRTDLEKELPISEHLLNRVENAIPLISANKDLFGPGVGGIDFLGGPNQRYRGLKNPKKIAAFKQLSNLFAELQGKQASDFSSRSLNIAFDLAKQAKTSMEDHPDAAIQTLQDIAKKMKESVEEDRIRFKNAGGKLSESSKSKPGRLKYNPVTGRLE